MQTRILGRTSKSIRRDGLTSEQIRVERHNAAEQRRALFREMLARNHMTPADLSRRAGFTTGNVLYNFLSGASSTLSLDTVTKLGQVISDLPAAILMGVVPAQPEGVTKLGDKIEPTVPAALAKHLARTSGGMTPKTQPLLDHALHLERFGLEVQMIAQSGHLVNDVRLAKAERAVVGAPLKQEWITAKPFAVQVQAPGAEEIYPVSTLLVCLPVKNWLGSLLPGRRVVITRTRQHDRRKITSEITVRELVQEDGKVRLKLRSCIADEPPILLPREYTGGPWQQDHHSLRIVGLVMMACIPEVTFPNGSVLWNS